MRRAFSLIELSIVLVILGLLTGGILAGKSLIRAAELRSVSTEINRYTSATYAFRDKYLALPGDMPNAVKFWGAQAGGTADGVDAACRDLTAVATGTATCNGNGDGIVVNNLYAFEAFRYWQHLANAGLVEGQYSGVNNGAANTITTPVIGGNVPASKFTNVGYTIQYYAPQDATSANYYPSPMGMIYWIGTNNHGNYTAGIAFKAEETWNIDSKLDDGRPGFGAVLVSKTSGTNCVTSATADTAEYALDKSAIACSIIYRTKF